MSFLELDNEITIVNKTHYFRFWILLSETEVIPK